ncbi:MAG: MFS transporter [Bacteroidota bacterium]
MPSNSPPLYTLQFLLLCLSHALFSASFNMIIPELPSYLEQMGGADYKGLIIALFTLTAGISRPFSGKLTDTIGRVPVMIIGTLVCVVCSLFYPFATSVFGFLLLRLFHGFSTGFKPTATTAYAADIVPMHRRGEAMGILGVSMNAGASIAPPIGSALTMSFSIEAMFYCSSAMALLSVLILWGMQETLEHQESFKWKLLVVKKDEIIDLKALPPAIVMVLTYFTFGVMLTIVPDQSVHIGVQNKGLFFMSFTACSVASRLVAGKASDKYGRLPIIKLAIVLLILSLIAMGYADSPTWLLVASGMIGFSAGTLSPALFAWTIDRSDSANRGRSMATIYIALEIGIGLGALLSAAIYDNTPTNFDDAFNTTAFFCLLALLYIQFIYKHRSV